MAKCKGCGSNTKLDRDGFCSTKCRTEYYKENPSEYAMDKRKRKTKGCLYVIIILLLIFFGIINKNDEEKTNDIKTEDVQSVKTNPEKNSSSKDGSNKTDEVNVPHVKPNSKSSVESPLVTIKETTKQNTPAAVNEDTHSVEEIKSLPDVDSKTDSMYVSKKERKKNIRKGKKKSK